MFHKWTPVSPPLTEELEHYPCPYLWQVSVIFYLWLYQLDRISLTKALLASLKEWNALEAAFKTIGVMGKIINEFLPSEVGNQWIQSPSFDKQPSIIWSTGYPLQYSWASLINFWWRIRLQCKRPWFDSWVGKVPWRRDGLPTAVFLGFLVAQLVKNPSAMRETWIRSLGWKDPLEKGKATHSSIVAWRIPWSEYSPWSRKE